MNIAVCEDDQIQREKIKMICDCYFSQKGQPYRCMEYADGGTLLAEPAADIDLLFLDIELGDAPDGIQVMNELERVSSVRKIVFLSGHSEFVWDSFGWKTLGFVRKPFADSQIIHWLDVVNKELGAQRLFEFHTEKGKRLFSSGELEALHAEGNYVRLVTDAERFFASGSLKYWMEQLKGTNFVQIHKSYAINLEYVTRLGDTAETKTGSSYPVGRVYRKAAAEAYRQFVLCRMRERV